MEVFENIESEVRSYCRSFPKEFIKAKGALITDSENNEYIDFLAGAGSLNYGHNPDFAKKAMIDYINSEGLLHGLDMMTTAKKDFLEKFNETILEPRSLNYKVQFTGPTGTNAVEAALKVARKYTGRQLVYSFTRGFHGMTLGSLALTGNKSKRKGAGVSLENTRFLPFNNYFGEDINTCSMIKKLLDDPSSGYELPAAMILETIQGEGGVNIASNSWLQEIQSICKERDILLIVDDIQVGCGRTGTFFSFEDSEIEPDIVCLSKSLSGCGLPFALTLFKPELDLWEPGEHNGTFRGNNLAFVTATSSLDMWKNSNLEKSVREKEGLIRSSFQEIQFQRGIKDIRGKGLVWGIEFLKPSVAGEVAKKCFSKGIIIETSGPEDQVLKLLPPLTIKNNELKIGLKTIKEIILAHPECKNPSRHLSNHPA